MAYEKKTIAKVMDEIDERQIMLPSIQRKYVWEEAQITKLMDSIMRKYPFGTFLFWRVKKSTVNERGYPMYEFIKNYHERDSFRNPPISRPFTLNSENSSDSVIAVLDGQQRLTSLYISLKGSLAFKLPRKQWKNDDAFPEKELYFNLLSNPDAEDEDIIYEFKFLTEADLVMAEEKLASGAEDAKVWYKVKEILRYTEASDIELPMMMSDAMLNKRMMTNLSRLFYRIKNDELINYFEVESPTDSIDDVLDIFVRVNSGGTVLSKTDLLFSTIVAKWQSARDDIDGFLERINKLGEGYQFTNDFIMRACLYLLDMQLALKVDSFGNKNVEKIRANWGEIKSALTDTVRFLAERGFNYENIISTNAVLPVAYYRYKYGAEAFARPEVRREWQKFLVVAQLKQIFGGATSNTLTILRDSIKDEIGENFTLVQMDELTFTGGRNLKVGKDEIAEWVDNYEKGPYTFMMLSLLYPDNKYSSVKFEQDHMHPISGFEKNALAELMVMDEQGQTLHRLDDDEKAEWARIANTVSNLQFLTSTENQSKNDTPLEIWLKDHRDLAGYLPEIQNYGLAYFLEFLRERRTIILRELERVLL